MKGDKDVNYSKKKILIIFMKVISIFSSNLKISHPIIHSKYFRPVTWVYVPAALGNTGTPGFAFDVSIQIVIGAIERSYICKVPRK